MSLRVSLILAQLWLTLIHALKYKPFQTACAILQPQWRWRFDTCPSILRARFVVVFQVVKWGLFWTKGYFEAKSSERNNRKSQMPRCELYLVSRAWAASAVASSSGETWRPCSDVWCKLLAGSVTPTVCVHVCVLHCCQNFELFFQVGSEESLQSWLIEHQSSEGLTLHKLLSQA